MKITIEPTGLLTTLDGVDVRVWNGVSDQGTPCVVFVHRVAVSSLHPASDIVRELKEKMPPGNYVPLKHIL